MKSFNKSIFIKLSIVGLLTWTSTAYADDLAVDTAANDAFINGLMSGILSPEDISPQKIQNESCAQCATAAASQAAAPAPQFKALSLNANFFRQLTGQRTAPVIVPPAPRDGMSSAQVAAHDGIFYNQRTQDAVSPLKLPTNTVNGWDTNSFSLPGSIGNASPDALTKPALAAGLAWVGSVPAPKTVSFKEMNALYTAKNPPKNWLRTPAGTAWMKKNHVNPLQVQKSMTE